MQIITRCSLCGLLAAGSLKAVVVRHDLALSVYQDLATQSPFTPVVRIEVATDFGTRTGSGVVVGEGWVLTAAHVVWGARAESVGVRLGSGRATALDVRFAPGWSGSPATGLTQVGDLALVRVDSTSGTPAAVLANTVEAGMVGFFGGYGRTGNGVLGAAGPPSLAFAMNVIDRHIALPGGGWLVTDFDDGSISRNSLDAETARRTHYDVGFENPTLSSLVLDAGSGRSAPGFIDLPTAADFFPSLPAEFLEGTTAAGDSGGPMFVYDSLGSGWVLAGLASWGVNPLLPAGFSRNDSRYGDLAFFTDLTHQRDWISAVIPEPAGHGMPLAAIFMLMMRRRRNLASGGRRCSVDRMTDFVDSPAPSNPGLAWSGAGRSTGPPP